MEETKIRKTANSCGIPKCHIRSTWTSRDSDEPQHWRCVFHKLEYDIPLVFQCQKTGCTNKAGYLFKGELPSRCPEHRLTGMKLYKQCDHENCTQTPIWRVPGDPARKCTRHRLWGMTPVYVKCIEPSCYRKAMWGYANQDQPSRCYKHSGPDMMWFRDRKKRDRRKKKKQREEKEVRNQKLHDRTKGLKGKNKGKKKSKRKPRGKASLEPGTTDAPFPDPVMAVGGEWYLHPSPEPDITPETTHLYKTAFRHLELKPIVFDQSAFEPVQPKNYVMITPWDDQDLLPTPIYQHPKWSFDGCYNDDCKSDLDTASVYTPPGWDSNDDSAFPESRPVSHMHEHYMARADPTSMPIYPLRHEEHVRVFELQQVP